jgi:hypothetical protein
LKKSPRNGNRSGTIGASEDSMANIVPVDAWLTVALAK